jgi:hypothetical protein
MTRRPTTTPTRPNSTRTIHSLYFDYSEVADNKGLTTETGRNGGNMIQNPEADGASDHSIHRNRGGRPRVVVDLAHARLLLDQGVSIRSAALALDVGEGTLRRALGLVRLGTGGSDALQPRQNPQGGTL